MDIDPSFYGISARVKLTKTGNNKIGIYKVVKSRIIRKDALKITEIASRIRTKDPNLKIALICTPNICSKSIKILEKEDIEISFTE